MPERAGGGAVQLKVEAVTAGYPAIGSRLTPESLARKVAGRSGATRAAEALGACGLWESRRQPFASLSPGAQAACELIPLFAGEFGLLAIDAQLERLDPWIRGSVLELLSSRLAKGAAAVIVTSLVELAPRTDLLTIWKGGAPVFAGAYRDLERRLAWTEMTVETLREASARSLCDPFEVSVQSTDGGLKLKAKEGQALAASLLLDGYGDVRALVKRRPTPEEVLRGL